MIQYIVEKGGIFDKGVDNLEVLQVILDAIGSLGFPIVLSVIMMYILYREQEKHEAEIDKLIEALNNNTTIMTELKSLVLDLKEMIISLQNDLDEMKRGD